MSSPANHPVQHSANSPAPDPHRHQEFDNDVRPGPILAVVFGLVVIIITSMILMWWLSGSLKGKSEGLDPTPSPIPEASERRLPPGPRLQPSPEAELIEMRRDYDQLLSNYGWVDKRNGIARIPVERAIELLAERGLPASRSLALVPPGATTPGERSQGVDGEITQEELGDGPVSGGVE